MVPFKLIVDEVQGLGSRADGKPMELKTDNEMGAKVMQGNYGYVM